MGVEGVEATVRSEGHCIVALGWPRRRCLSPS